MDKDKIIDYLVKMLEFLDGQGIVFTDEELVKEALKDFGDFEVLQKIIKGNK